MNEREIIAKEWRDDNGILHRREVGRELIRCKECKHNYNTAINHGKMNPRCNFTDYKLTENDYCSRGERKESE